MVEETRILIHKRIVQLRRCDAKWNLLQLYNDKYFLEYVLEYLIDKRRREIDNYNYYP